MTRDTMTSPQGAYEQLERQHAEECDRARRTALALSSLRGLVFLAALAALVLWDMLTGTTARLALGGAALLIVGFVLLVSRHRRVRKEERRQETLRSLAAQGLLRLDRRWEELETALPEVERHHPGIPADHPYALDLDVFGTASLTRLAGPVTSASGRRTLRGWLLSPPAEGVRARQDAVGELARALPFRHELAARGRLATPSEEAALAALLDWAESTPRLLEHRWTLVAAWVLPALVVVPGVLWALRGLPPWWIVPLAVQLWVLGKVRKQLAESFKAVEDGAAALQAAGPQIRLMEDAIWRAPLLTDLTARLATDGRPAHRTVANLVRLTDVAVSRRNLIYGMLAPIFLLDIHLGSALDRWRAHWGREVRGWLKAVGVMEALSALATIAHEHPDWTTATWNDESDAAGGSRLRARALGHPLLHPDACVRNDVEVGPADTFLFITGSNMSGKSTLLRAVGANVVLAGAGAPVCAVDLALPQVRLWTSMRIDDSLADGISRFMAELLRVRAIVEAARDHTAGEPPVLYLLDEMLQGTNTAERRVAARAILRHLVGEAAIGAVTSHDLTLADDADLVERRRAFHFREHVESDEDGTHLTFDYVLRPGLATTSNALRLLEAVGLGGERSD